MAQISNNILAALLLLAIVISGAGVLSVLTITAPKLTGAATSGSGVTNLTISSIYSILMLRNMSDFGTGDIISGQIYHIYTNATNTNAGASSPFRNGSEGNGSDYGTGTYVYPFVIENDGNDNTTCVQLEGNPAATFIGSGAVFEASEKDNETAEGPSCEGNKAFTWQPVNVTNPMTVCQQLHSDGTKDSIRIHWHLGIPDSAVPETKSNTITITALNSC